MASRKPKAAPPPPTTPPPPPPGPRYVPCPASGILHQPIALLVDWSGPKRCPYIKCGFCDFRGFLKKGKWKKSFGWTRDEADASGHMVTDL